MKNVHEDSILKIDRGGLLNIPYDQHSSFIFSGAVLAPEADFTRLGPGQFTLVHENAVRVQPLDVILDENNKKALVLGVADGDTAQAPSMRGVFVAAMYFPLKKMGGRFKTETDTFYLGPKQIKSVLPGEGARLPDVNGFIKSYTDFRGMYTSAELLQRHLKLPFEEQVERIETATLEHIATDVALKMRAQPAVATKTLNERNGQCKLYANALLKKKQFYGLPFKERFKSVDRPAPPPPPEPPVQPPPPTASNTAPTSDAPTAAVAITTSAAAPTTSPTAAAIPKPTAIATAKAAAPAAVPKPVALPATEVAVPVTVTPAPALVPGRTGTATAPSKGMVTQPPTAASLAHLFNIPSAPTPVAKPIAADAPAPAASAAPQNIEDLDGDDDADIYPGMFGGDNNFPTLQELGLPKKKRKQRDGVDESLILDNGKRAAPKAGAEVSQAQPAGDGGGEKRGKLLSGSGVRGGPGAYLTLRRAQEIAQMVKQGVKVASPEQKRAAEKLGKSSLRSPSPTHTSLSSLDSAGILDLEAKYKRLESKYETTQDALCEARRNLAVREGEVAAKNTVIAANEKEISKYDEAAKLVKSQYAAEIARLQVQHAAEIKELRDRLSAQQAEVEDLRKNNIMQFERGLERGMAMGLGRNATSTN